MFLKLITVICLWTKIRCPMIHNQEIKHIHIILEKTSFIETLSNPNERSLIRYLVAHAQWKLTETDSWMNYFPLRASAPDWPRESTADLQTLTPGREKDDRGIDRWPKNLHQVCKVHCNSAELFTKCVSKQSFISNHTSDSRVQDWKFSSSWVLVTFITTCF